MKGMNLKQILLFLVAGLLASGCVSQQKYDELKLANRNCNANRERLAQDLVATRARTGGLEKEIAGMGQSNLAKDQTIRNLQSEADAARDTIRKMTDVYEALAAARIPSGQITISPLPPELDSALKQFAADNPGTVQYDANRGVVKLVSDVLFDLGSDQIKSQAIASLEQLAKIVGSQAAEDFDVVVVGHTDDIRIGKPQTRAKHPTNWHLSVHRSIAVMNVLEGAGVKQKKIGVMGYGQYRPLVPNDSAENRAQNRRVEIYLVGQKAVATQ